MTTDSPSLFETLFDAPVASAPKRVVPVMVPMPAPRPYSYAVPEEMHVEPGSIVQVPLGPRQVIGVVWDGDDEGAVDASKLRPVTTVFDCPPLTRDHRRFLEWVATYTLSPPGLVARMALRAPVGAPRRRLPPRAGTAPARLRGRRLRRPAGRGCRPLGPCSGRRAARKVVVRRMP